MKPTLAFRSFLLGSSLLAIATSAQAANVIVNGNFETGDLTGWTQNGTGTTVSSTSPLAGTYSAVQVLGTSSRIYQSFTAITSSVTTSFIFSANDPGGATDRSFNVTFRDDDTLQTTINLRLVDDNADGDGDIQIYNQGISNFTTVLSNAVTFGATTSLSLTINSFGTGANYDLTVGAASATGLTYFQGTDPFDKYNELSVVNSGFAAAATSKIDNVSVDAIPEPSAALLGSLGLLALLRRRRN